MYNWKAMHEVYTFLDVLPKYGCVKSYLVFLFNKKIVLVFLLNKTFDYGGVETHNKEITED